MPRRGSTCPTVRRRWLPWISPSLLPSLVGLATASLSAAQSQQLALLSFDTLNTTSRDQVEAFIKEWSGTAFSSQGSRNYTPTIPALADGLFLGLSARGGLVKRQGCTFSDGSSCQSRGCCGVAGNGYCCAEIANCCGKGCCYPDSFCCGDYLTGGCCPKSNGICCQGNSRKFVSSPQAHGDSSGFRRLAVTGSVSSCSHERSSLYQCCANDQTCDAAAHTCINQT